MPSVYKRSRTDGSEAVRWTISYKGVDGKYKTATGYADKRKSEEKARKLETEAAQVRDGMLPAAELTRRAARVRSMAEHIEDYRLHLMAKGDTPDHCDRIASVLVRLMDGASATDLGKLTATKIQGAVHRMRLWPRSVRTCNHAIGAARAFGKWLAANDRVERDPMRTLAPLPSGSGRVYERGALTADQQARLLETAESGDPIKISRRGYQYQERWITGPERAMLYRIALETGFRISEIRRLKPDGLHDDLDPPSVHLEKQKKGGAVDQQIRPEFAARFRRWIDARAELPLFVIPEKTAKLLRHDLKAAGIPAKDAKGLIIDFHALRATYVTNLIRGGASVKTTQMLARHSTPVLTIGIYAKSDAEDKAKALDSLPPDLRRPDRPVTALMQNGEDVS